MTLPNDLEMLDELIKRYYKELLKSVEENAKLGDLIKMMEQRRKLAPGDSDQKQFWKMMENIRRETLVSPKPGRRGKKTGSELALHAKAFAQQMNLFRGSGYAQSIPMRIAHTAICVRSFIFSFRRICCKCSLTVS